MTGALRVRQNRVVPTPVAGAKLPVAHSIRPDRSAIKPAVMEARGIRLQGERGISRQPIAQGMPECSGCTCMLVCALFALFAHETAGAASTRHSLLPLFGGQRHENLGRKVPRECETASSRHCERSEAIH